MVWLYVAKEGDFVKPKKTQTIILKPYNFVFHDRVKMELFLSPNELI